MSNTKIYAIGLMSGTSLDGLDIVYVSFASDDLSDFKIIQSQTLAYTQAQKEELKNSIHLHKEELQNLDESFGEFLGNAVEDFKKNYQITTLDFIASHGHTVFHDPKNGITKQIGSGEVISRITNDKVVYDFRLQDVALGGQGAPLVPIGDQILFQKYDACLNLGGFANISYEFKGERIAFDISPVNVVLNFLSNQLGKDYDNEGMLAKSGELDKNLFDKLNNLSFYSQKHPKSLGIEWVFEHIFPLVEKEKSPIENQIRTFTEHVAFQISKVLKGKNNVLITGGGAYNKFLISCLKNNTTTQLILPKRDLIEYKEALIFALLGVLKIQGKVNCLKSVTGAKKNHSSGIIIPPKTTI